MDFSKQFFWNCQSMSILFIWLTLSSVKLSPIGITRNKTQGTTTASTATSQTTINSTRERWDGIITTDLALNLDETNENDTHARLQRPPAAPTVWEPPNKLIRNYAGHQYRLPRTFFNNKSHIAIYFNFDQGVSGFNYSKHLKTNLTWLYDYTSRIWPYMIQTYGQMGPDPYLTMIIRTAREARAELTFSRQRSEKNDLRNMLDITSERQYGWLSMESHCRNEELDRIVNQLAYFVERSSKDRFGSPSHAVWKGSSYDNTAWDDIFTYDVYKNLNMTEHAQRYKQHSEDTSENQPKDITFWFRDWFLPIYENHGGNKVLNEYFELLHQYLPFLDITYNFNLTLGDFVHFWSGAAKIDLQTVARGAFGWNDTYREQFNVSRIRFPAVTRLYTYIPLPYETTITTTTTTTTTTDPTTTTTSTTASTTTTTTMTESTKSNMAISLTVAVPLVSIVVVLLIAFVIFYKRKIRNLNMEIRNLTAEEINEFFEGGSNLNNDDETQDSVLAMPFVKDFEIPRDQIILATDKGIIGSGQFGSVIHGFVRLTGSDQPDQLVAVAMKMIKPNLDVGYFKAFLLEVKIMAFLGHHENIVRLVGTCTTNIKDREIFIAMELCPLGNLHQFLKKNRTNFLTVAEEQASTVNVDGTDRDMSTTITTSDLLKWSKEISNAMMYLTQKKVIHGDLAARNILLSERRVAKISDFGLSRQILNYANYMKTSRTPVPWRWLAIESLKEMTFSTASDVWAFGVTVWEIFSLAEVPYGAWTFDLFFADKLAGGDRLLRPTHANEQIYGLMHACWKKEPGERPTFEKIHAMLREFINQPNSQIMQFVDGDVEDSDLYIDPVSIFDPRENRESETEV